MERKGISGSTLKIIAIVTMIIDHIGAAVLARILISGQSANREMIFGIYWLMRIVGRIAFPIYCFLLIEGFEHTKDIRRYIFRLGLFAVISEIPFDLAFSGTLLEFGYQNVFFTLFIGLLTVALFHTVEERTEWHPALRVLALVCIMGAGMALAYFMHTDYDALGVMCILVFYIFRKNKKLQMIAGMIAFFWWELPALFAFIPIYFYNGTRGIRMKYAFYIIYPAHLMILYLISYWMGLAEVAVV